MAALMLFGVGLAYRATFLAQGFNATDEGWVLSVAQRITQGQVPYRDFNFSIPPVVIYKEAALIQLFGHAYSLLASRWVFSIEAAIGTVLAYFIIRRFVGPGLAFLATLPTIVFSVLLYYFSNYTHDGELMLLAAALLLFSSSPETRWRPAAAGAFAALAFLSKQNFAAFAVLVPVLGLTGAWLERRNGRAPHRSVYGIRHQWPYFVAGFVTLAGIWLGYMQLVGGGRRFISLGLLLSLHTHPGSLRFALWQDVPDTILAPSLLPFYALIFLLVISMARARSRRALAVAMLGLLIVLGLALVPNESPIGKLLHLTPLSFLFFALGVLLMLSLLAAAISLTGAGFIPAELAILALALQYLAQFTDSGVRYSYLGTYLTVPVAILTVIWATNRARPPSEWRVSAGVLLPAGAFLAWFALGSAGLVRDAVYRDYPRPQLNATFRSGKLAGIQADLNTVARLDAATAAIDRLSRPGDAAFVFPDLSALYYVTGRRNPTRQDWYYFLIITPAIVDQSVRDLAHDPPRVVLLQAYDEADFSRVGARIRYEQSSLFSPIYDYLRMHYRVVDRAGDIEVMIPR